MRRYLTPQVGDRPLPRRFLNVILFSVLLRSIAGFRKSLRGVGGLGFEVLGLSFWQFEDSLRFFRFRAFGFKRPRVS